MSFFTKGRSPLRGRTRYGARPRLEELETRVVPYTTTGTVWPSANLVTISFIPDGTVMTGGVGGNITSNLFSAFNQIGTTTNWENAILKAAQTWSQVANVNFAVVTDNGTASGGGSYQQGDPAMGDIRIGGYDFGGNESTLGSTYLPPPANNFSIAGDITFNTGAGYKLGGVGGYDLYTVAVHEIGHSLGLGESSDSLAAMYGTYAGKITGLGTDDVSGVQALYGARPADSSNNSFASATDLTSSINSSTLTALVNNQNLNSGTSADYFKFTTPSGTNSTIQVQVQTAGLSLMAPVVTVYASDQHTVVGSASGSGKYGATITATVRNVTGGSTYYVKVYGTGSPTNDGVYALSLNLGTGSFPTVTLPNTQLLNGNPQTLGSGLAQTADGPGQQLDVLTVSTPDGSFGPTAASPVVVAAVEAVTPATILATPNAGPAVSGGIVNAAAPANLALAQLAVASAGIEPSAIVAAPVPAQAVSVTAANVVAPQTTVANTVQPVSATFVIGGSSAPVAALPDDGLAPAAVPAPVEGGSAVPAAPVSPSAGAVVPAETNNKDVSLRPQSCDRFFANQAAVERLTVIDTPTVAAQTVEDVAAAPVFNDSETDVAETHTAQAALLLPAAVLLGLNQRPRQLDRRRRHE